MTEEQTDSLSWLHTDTDVSSPDHIQQVLFLS